MVVVVVAVVVSVPRARFSILSVIGQCGFVGVSAELDSRFGCAENLKFERS